jgi:hypothetical protein
MPIQVQEPSRTKNKLDQNWTNPWHITIRTSTKHRERTLKAIREKKNNIQR